MINTAQIRSAVEVTDGDVVGLTKAQIGEILAAVEEGQQAKRSLTILEGVIAMAAGPKKVAG